MIKFLTSIFLLHGVLASSPLNPRQITDEQVHLTDCIGLKSQTSVVVYCQTPSLCNQPPSPQNTCTMPKENNSLYTWEQRTQGCTFQQTNTRFVWDLEADARDGNKFKKDNVIGSGSNGFHRFDCKRNNDPVLFTDGEGRQCRSLYYCINIT